MSRAKVLKNVLARLALTGVIALGAVHQCQLRAQPLASASSFDVVSVKPNKSGSGMRAGSVDPTNYRASNLTLKALIEDAYRVQETQISGGPGWADVDRYDVDAKTERPAGSDQQALMLRALLSDRFQLKLHKETKELRAYVLSVGKNGAKIHAIDPGAISDRATAMMEGFARALSQMLNPPPGRGANGDIPRERLPVLDRTGLKGSFEIDGFLHAALGGNDGGRSARTRNDELLGSIESALDRQLGLKLDVQKTPVEILVIDHAERPSGN